MHWLAPPGEEAWKKAKGQPNRTALRREVEQGELNAVLAIEDAAAIGWCRAGPTASFARLARSRKLTRERMADWAVVCFFVHATHRRRGVSVALLRAAARLAAREGARSIEGYPVVPRKGTVPPPFAWTGLAATFQAAGFSVVRHDAGARRIYKLEIDRP